MNFAGARLDQVEDENIRNVVNGRRRVAQIVQQIHHAFHVPNRQGDENHVGAVGLDVGAEVAQGSDQFGVGLHAEPLAAAIVEEAFDLEPHAGVGTQPAGQLQAAGVIAGDDGAALVEGVEQETAHDFLHGQRREDQSHRGDRRPGQKYAARIDLQRRLGDVTDGEQHGEQQQPADDHIDHGR